MASCKDCIHERVCVIKAFPDAFENTEWSKEPCDHFESKSEGEWEKASEFMPIYRCSICKERNLFKNGNNVFSNFCPNCGAKMKGE